MTFLPLISGLILLFKGPDGFKVEGLTCIKASFAEKGKCHFRFYFELVSYFYYVHGKSAAL